MRPRWSMTLLVAAAVLFAACGSDTGVDSGDANGGGTTTAASASTIPGGTTTPAGVTTTAASTTVPETTVPATTLPATTVPATTLPATTAAPVTPPPTSAPVALTPLLPDTNLQPDSTVTVTVPADANACDFLTQPGWVTETCEAIVASEIVYALVLRDAGDGHFWVLVMVPASAPGTYVSAFSVEEPGPGTLVSVTVVHGSFHFGEGPFNGDAEGLWVGYRYTGTGQSLDVDIIEWLEDGSPRRGAIKLLDHGAVDVRPGGADVLSAVYAAADPNCCPSSFLRQEVSWTSDWWHIDAGVLLPAGDPGTVVTSDF